MKNFSILQHGFKRSHFKLAVITANEKNAAHQNTQTSSNRIQLYVNTHVPLAWETIGLHPVSDTELINGDLKA